MIRFIPDVTEESGVPDQGSNLLKTVQPVAEPNPCVGIVHHPFRVYEGHGLRKEHEAFIRLWFTNPKFSLAFLGSIPRMDHRPACRGLE